MHAHANHRVAADEDVVVDADLLADRQPLLARPQWDLRVVVAVLRQERHVGADDAVLADLDRARVADGAVAADVDAVVDLEVVAVVAVEGGLDVDVFAQEALQGFGRAGVGIAALADVPEHAHELGVRRGVGGAGVLAGFVEAREAAGALSALFF